MPITAAKCRVDYRRVRESVLNCAYFKRNDTLVKRTNYCCISYKFFDHQEKLV